MTRRMAIGAELGTGEAGVHVRVWAPQQRVVTLVVEAPERREITLRAEPGGYHAGFAPGLAAGALYRFRLGHESALLPDPASRFQPQGPFGPSEVIDPAAFPWTDQAWRGIAPARHVLYELHVGTFTPEGTYAAAREWLPYLADVGITTIELMPLAQWDGRHNWGYDGVNLFAPPFSYGRPDELRAFVDRAHAVGLAVILDVVYNHFGPSGNTMYTWSPYYKSAKATEWGDAIDFDGEHSAAVREYFIANAGYWIDEYHLDGFRFDATQSIHDRSPEHVITAIARRAREAGAGRQIFLAGENEPQDVTLLQAPTALDALWNDDFHHTARVALTGLVDGYLDDYRGTAQELVSAIKHGFLYQGQRYAWQDQPRGTCTRGLARRRMVHFLENHDQVANIGFGERLPDLADAGVLRAMTALLLLSPQLPMLFQGQEAGSRRPWHFFADHCGELGEAVRRGRMEFVSQFARLATPEARAALADPCDEATFTACKLEPALRSLDNPMVRLYRDLLRLRREDPAFTDERPTALDGAVLCEDTFAIRFFQDDPADDRLLLVNLGRTYAREVVPEPLIAPPHGTGWRVLWSSEAPAYGGHGTPPPFDEAPLRIPARAAVVLAPDRALRKHRKDEET